MNRLFATSILSASLAGLAGAQDFVIQPPPQPLPKVDQPKADEPKKDTPKVEPPAVPPPVTLPAIANRPVTTSAGLTAAGTSFSRSSQPNVYGNDPGLPGRYSPVLIATLPNGQRQAIQPGQQALLPLGTTFDRAVATQIITVTTPQPPGPNGAPEPPINQRLLQVTGPDAVAHAGGLPINVVRGALKIGENESPRPQDRIYATYNFFADVNGSLVVPGLPNTTVHRETLGLEKTFLDGNASIGLRLPLIQIGGPGNIRGQGMGDLTAILKYAIVNEFIERGDGTIAGGNVLSAGIAVTAPTGDTVTYAARTPVIHATMLQPFVGATLTRESWFVQGFSSVAVPTDDRDTTWLFNSLQVGYTLYEDPTQTRILRSLSPILECHVNTPLTNRGLSRLPIGAMDQVSITAGTTIGLGRSAVLNLGANVPLTGPKPYSIETIAQLNWRF
jgi:hypothetical protein